MDGFKLTFIHLPFYLVEIVEGALFRAVDTGTVVDVRPIEGAGVVLVLGYESDGRRFQVHQRRTVCENISL